MIHLKQGILPITYKVLRQETQDWWAEGLSTLAIPLSFFLAFGLGLQGYINNVEGVPYIVFLAPGLITMTMMLESYRTGAWGLWLDKWYQKMIDEYRIKPIFTSDIIIGEILGGFTVAVCKAIMVAMILRLLAPVPMPWQHLPAYLLYVLPGCILFTCVSSMVGMTFKKPDQIAQVQTIVVTPLLYLGGLFFPIKAFPAWLIPIIHWLPTTALFDGGREAFLTGHLNAHYVWLLWGCAIASFAIATRYFNWKLSE